jgi:hypothetical protein
MRSALSLIFTPIGAQHVIKQGLHTGASAHTAGFLKGYVQDTGNFRPQGSQSRNVDFLGQKTYYTSCLQKQPVVPPLGRTFFGRLPLHVLRHVVSEIKRGSTCKQLFFFT